MSPQLHGGHGGPEDAGGLGDAQALLLDEQKGCALVLWHLGEHLLQKLHRGLPFVSSLGRGVDGGQDLVQIFERNVALRGALLASVGVQKKAPSDGVSPRRHRSPRQEATPGVVHLQKGLLQEVFREVGISRQAVEVGRQARGEVIVDERKGSVVSFGVARHGFVGTRKTCALSHGICRTTRPGPLGTT